MRTTRASRYYRRLWGGRRWNAGAARRDASPHRTAVERRPYQADFAKCGGGRREVEAPPRWRLSMRSRRSATLPWGGAADGTAALLWEQMSRANRKAIRPLQFRRVSASVHLLGNESSPSASASRKPVTSPSYSHSAAFAALAWCNPYSEVPPTSRTRGAGPISHSSGTGRLLLSSKPDGLRWDV